MNYDKSLDVGKIDEMNANGLQFVGKEEISKIGFGVSASKRLFQKAVQSKCDCLIVHHGLRNPENPPLYNKVFQRSYSYLVQNNLSLFGYHFLLDSHPNIGHNAIILKSIGITKKQKLLDWGYWGDLPQKTDIDTIVTKCEKIFKQKPIVYKFKRNKVKRIGAISGSGSFYGKDLQKLIDIGIELYITGDPREGTRELYHEAEISLIGGGHYATERLGLLALWKYYKRNLKAMLNWNSLSFGIIFNNNKTAAKTFFNYFYNKLFKLS